MGLAGMNWQPQDLQSDTLPTALSCPVGIYLIIQNMSSNFPANQGFLSSNTEWHTQMLHENKIIS